VDLAVFAEVPHVGNAHEHGWYCTNCKRHFKNLFHRQNVLTVRVLGEKVHQEGHCLGTAAVKCMVGEI
jgi:hypothetical protein